LCQLLLRPSFGGAEFLDVIQDCGRHVKFAFQRQSNFTPHRCQADLSFFLRPALEGQESDC
jgi:hypothetical protein